MPEDRSFFDTLSDVGKAAGYAMNPFSAVLDAVTSERSTNGTSSTLERNDMSIYSGFGEGQSSFGTSSSGSGSTSSSGFFGNLGRTVRDFGSDVGGFVADITPTLDLFGINTPLQRTNSGVATTINRQPPDESASSGELLGANLGLGGNLIQAASRFARSPGGGTAIGFGAGALGAALGGGQNGMPRITRRMKSDVRKIYMMAGMDPNATAQILNNLGTYPRMRFDASLVFFILTKRFRNDGPVVTKAAVRKTKSTLRRMKGVVDMYNSVCKPTTRRAPMRRAAPKAVQLIKN